MTVGDYLSNAGPMDKRKICRTNVEMRNTTGIKRAILYQRKRARVCPTVRRGAIGCASATNDRGIEETISSAFLRRFF